MLDWHKSVLREFDKDGNKRIDASERAAWDKKWYSLTRAQYHHVALLTLEGFYAAQEDVRECRHIDVNGDGKGEYGFLVELAGKVARRGSPGKPGKKERSYYITRESEWRWKNGRVSGDHGYIIQLFLPGKDGIPMGETAKGPAGLPKPSPEHAAKAWCAYAWPVELGRTGTRVFFISQAGMIMEAESPRYSGTNAPSGTAALPKGTTSMHGLNGKQRTGNDGLVWKPLPRSARYKR